VVLRLVDDADRGPAAAVLDGRPRPLVRAGLARLDPGIVDAAIADRTTHDDVRADHDRVLAAGGYGVPTLFFPEHLDDEGRPECFFGPVMLDPPTGAAALRLWESVTAWLEFPYLFELQRPKRGVHGAVIADRLRPYLEARDWVSIDRGRVVSFDR
jgi:hypothetical protein